MTAQAIETATMREAAAEGAAAGPEHGAEVVVPLNRLKASPRNARKTPHSAATIEALAASIRAKGVLQPPVVEVERDGEGVPTGSYLVTIGEGRRQGLRLLAKRKQIKRTHPVRCIVDAENDAHEISLDENMTREAMHPADQFEAFRRLAEEKGYGPEEIGARFGVSAHVVRQRLRLGSAAPELMTAYRKGTLALDQLTAFCVSDDRDRQRQVLAQVGPHTPAYAIRRAMTETKVPVGERRVRFVGVEAYEAEGGPVLRDLFTEDGGGWLEDVGLLDRLVTEKLERLAAAAREGEGWAWSEFRLDYPDLSGFGRVYPAAVERSDEDAALLAALSEEYDRLVSETDAADMLPPEVDVRLTEIDAALQVFGPDYDYTPEARGRAGVMVILGYDGTPRYERGLVRAEDLSPEPPPWEADETQPDGGAGEAAGAAADSDGGSGGGGEAADDRPAPLSDRLVMELTAHKTMGLRDAVQADPGAALATVVHALALQVFYPGYGVWTPLQLRLTVSGLERLAPGVGDTPAGRRVADRCEAWGARLPERPEDLWAVVARLAPSEQLDLLACCAGVGLHAVRDPHDRRPDAWAQAETLATAVGLDMTGTWSATAASYFSRVSKARVLEAVTEAVNADEAGRIAGLRKGEMAEAAEGLVEGRGWLPPLLRTATPEDRAGAESSSLSADEAGEADASSAPATEDGWSFAAE
jgi:ParB family chromosome partitioning protein